MNTRQRSVNALKKAICLFKTQTALSKAIGVKQQRIWNWLHKSKCGVPAEYVLPIERATGGRVTRHELRPDLYPLEEENQAA